MVDDHNQFIEAFEGDILLVTGSLYFISEIKQHYNAKRR